MTYVHFLNCIALTFGPLFVFYKGTKLSEYSAFILCGYAALGYVATQAVKLLLLATFLPPMEEGGEFHIVPELVKAVVNCGDIVGMYLILNMKRLGDGEMRILGVAVGWAAAESLLRRLVPLWIGARQLEFSWEYIQMAIQANISLLGIVAFTTLVWLWSRSTRREGKGKGSAKEAPKDNNVPLIVGSLLLYSLVPVITSFLASSLKLDGWYILGAHAVFAVLFAVISQRLYSAHEQLAKKQS